MYPNSQEDEIDRFFKEQEEGFVKKEPQEVEPQSYEDEREVMKRRIEHEEKVARCTVFSKKYMTMFLILIGGIALSVVTLILTALGLSFSSFRSSVSTILVIISFLSFAISVGYGLVVYSLGNYHYEFRAAGLFYMLNGAMSALYNSVGGTLGFVFEIVAAIASVMYMLKFATAMSASFDNVATYMAITWETFRKVYTYFYYAVIILTLGSFVPVLGLIAAVGLLVLSVVAIALSIWQIILILRSSRVMKQYADAIFVG